MIGDDEVLHPFALHERAADGMHGPATCDGVPLGHIHTAHVEEALSKQSGAKQQRHWTHTHHTPQAGRACEYGMDTGDTEDGLR